MANDAFKLYVHLPLLIIHKHIHICELLETTKVTWLASKGQVLVTEASMKLEIYPSICPWVNLERIDNMNKIDSLRSYFSINLLKHPKASYHLQVPTTLIKHNLVPKLCWVHQGTQMAFVLARSEPITFLVQVSFLGPPKHI